MFHAGNPGSVGPSSRLGNNEEHAYLEKWKQLQKYVEPLKRMINKIDKDEGSALSVELEALFVYCLLLSIGDVMFVET